MTQSGVELCGSRLWRWRFVIRLAVACALQARKRLGNGSAGFDVLMAFEERASIVDEPVRQAEQLFDPGHVRGSRAHAVLYG